MEDSFSISIRFEGKDWSVSKTTSEITQFLEDLTAEIALNPEEVQSTIISFRDEIHKNCNSILLADLIKYLVEIPEIAISLKFRKFIEYSWYSSLCKEKRKESPIILPKDDGNCFFCMLSFSSCSCERTKWMILTEDFIGYTHSFTDQEFVDVLLLKEIQSCQHTEEETGHSRAIMLRTSQRVFTFHAVSTQEKEEWIMEIKEALNELSWRNVEKHYGSSFPRRKNNEARWYVNAHDYYQTLHEELQKATEEVFISGWWLCPELYLLRPASEHPESQIMAVLSMLADRGVKIYVLIYKEVSVSSVQMNSERSESRLKALGSPNIQIQRHPSHTIFTGTFKWSHHQKMVVIDQRIAFLGGIDLCFGRYDTKEHKLHDSEAPYHWNGIDYFNDRNRPFEHSEDYQQDLLKRKKEPRLPWHDVEMSVKGPAARDVAIHFIEYWNYVKIDLDSEHSLIMPDSRPDSEELRAEEVRAQQIIEARQPAKLSADVTKAFIKPKIFVKNNAGEDYSCVCEIVRSAGNWSLGLSDHEASIQQAYRELICNSQHFIFIENQFFISSTAGEPILNLVAQSIVDRIKRAHSEGQKFKVIILLPLLPDLTGDITKSDSVLLRRVLGWEYKTIERSETSMFTQLRSGGIEPSDYIRFYSLRNHALLNNRPITEMIYIHSKMMVVDDDVVIIGSANINERSQLGTRDSEIAMVVHDDQKIDSFMDGTPIKCANFAHGLRSAIFKEILGDEEADVADPLCDRLLNRIQDTARNNTEIYREIFGCYPDDTFSTYEECADNSKKIKNKEELLSNYTRLSGNIKGLIVEFPLQFLLKEDAFALKISMEGFASTDLLV